MLIDLTDTTFISKTYNTVTTIINLDMIHSYIILYHIQNNHNN